MPRAYSAINEPSRIHGERIRKTRLGLGLTQEELAKIFGVWRETITRIENGQFNIISKRSTHKILNERMRIWAEMNKGGKKKKYRTSRYKLPDPLKPTSTLPRYVSSGTRYWQTVNQLRKEAQSGRTNP